MCPDSLSEALASLSAEQRQRLSIEADQVTGLSARRAQAEERRERLRQKVVKKLPRLATPDGQRPSATDDAMAAAIEASPPKVVVDYEVQIREALARYNDERLLTEESIQLVAALRSKYRAVIQAKMDELQAREIAERYKTQFGAREEDWLVALRASEPARADEYQHAVETARDAGVKVKRISQEILEIHRRIERQIEVLLSQEEQLEVRLENLMRPLSRAKRAAIREQVEARIRDNPPEKRVRLLSQLVTELELRCGQS